MKIAKTVDDFYGTEIQTMLKTLYGRLSEENRRLLAGLEAKRMGHGGIQAVSELFGCSRPTIYKGIREIAEPNLLVGAGRSRRKGAGRKDAFAAHPKLEANLQEILKDTLAGDPMNPDVVWTHLNASQIKEKLSTKGINITLPTVRIVVKKKLGQTKSPKAESSRKM